MTESNREQAQKVALDESIERVTGLQKKFTTGVIVALGFVLLAIFVSVFKSGQLSDMSTVQDMSSNSTVVVASIVVGILLVVTLLTRSWKFLQGVIFSVVSLFVLAFILWALWHILPMIWNAMVYVFNLALPFDEGFDAGEDIILRAIPAQM